MFVIVGYVVVLVAVFGGYALAGGKFAVIVKAAPVELFIIGGSALGAFFVQRSRHDRRMAEARRRLATFKEEVVALSDLLDAQQERHRLLPHTDPDFKTPMQGQTRSTYDSVQGAIRRYREAVQAGDQEQATTRQREAARLLDKAVSKGVIHKNQAANKKSRMAHRAERFTVDAKAGKTPA